MKPKQPRRLTDGDVEHVLSLLDGWADKLTWELLIVRLQADWGRSYSRQALDRHTRIKDAFQLAKKRLRKGTKPFGTADPKLAKALERIRRLEAENDRMQLENSRLRERHLKWAYNAHIKRLDEKYLDQALPPVNRDPTKPK